MSYFEAMRELERFGESLKSELEAQISTAKEMADHMERSLAAGRDPADVVAQWRAYISAFDGAIAKVEDGGLEDGGLEALANLYNQLLEITEANEPNRGDGECKRQEGT